MKRLTQLKNFNYIKDSGGDLTTHQEYLAVNQGTVLNGCDTTTLYSLLAGTQGVIWGGANYMPHEAVKLYELVVSKQYGQAQELWQRMLPSLLFIWRAPYNPSVARAAQLRGYGTGNVRKPLRVLTKDQDKALQEAIQPLLSNKEASADFRARKTG